MTRAEQQPASAEALIGGAPSGAVSTWRPPAVVGKYRIEGILGSGGMGQVYRAWEEDLQRSVAVKFILRIELDPTVRERFMLEARATARIQHPHVVAIYAVHEFEGRPYLVMECLSGKTLKEVSKPMPWSRALELGVALADGLAAAHHQGVLHRDIKPDNAMLTDNGHVKLLDFGLAKFATRSSTPRLQLKPGTVQISPVTPVPTLRTGGLAGVTGAEGASPTVCTSQPPALTAEGTAVGTPGYMAPECWSGHATPRSDVYSLGAVLFELCAGHAPHAAVPPHALSFAAQERDAPDLTSVVPTVDPNFAAIVARCLARDPNARYASGKELHAALKELERPAFSGPLLSSSSARSPGAGLDDNGREATTARTMVFREVGPLLVSVHSPEAPNDSDWNAYLDLCRTKMAQENIGVLVVSAGGGPTPTQRHALRALLNERQVLAAIVTDAPMVLGIVTVMGWSNPAIRTFGKPEGLEDALRYLRVDGAMAERVRLEVGAMQRELA